MTARMVIPFDSSSNQREPFLSPKLPTVLEASTQEDSFGVCDDEMQQVGFIAQSLVRQFKMFTDAIPSPDNNLDVRASGPIVYAHNAKQSDTAQPPNDTRSIVTEKKRKALSSTVDEIREQLLKCQKEIPKCDLKALIFGELKLKEILDALQACLAYFTKEPLKKMKSCVTIAKAATASNFQEGIDNSLSTKDRSIRSSTDLPRDFREFKTAISMSFRQLNNQRSCANLQRFRLDETMKNQRYKESISRASQHHTGRHEDQSKSKVGFGDTVEPNTSSTTKTSDARHHKSSLLEQRPLTRTTSQIN